MKTRKQKSWNSPVKKLIWVFAAALMLLNAHQAMASTAENTTITNTVTVTWNDVSGANDYNTTATSIVTVALVSSQPNIVYASDTDSTENTAVDLTYTITGTANGDDTYTVTLTNPNNTSLSGATLPAVTTINDLGGTTLVEDTDGSSFEITVPFDGTDDSSVNSIVEDDWIVIGGTAYQVTSITENSGSSNTTTIELSSTDAGGTALAAPNGSAGDIIGERQTITISVTTGAFTDTTSVTGTHDIDATVSWTDGSVAQTTDTVITVHRPLLTVRKYVQVVAGGSTVSGSGYSIDVDTGSGAGTLTYYQNITAPPETTLEYIIVVENTGAGTTGQATNVVIEDSIPQFTSYVTGSMRLDPGTGTFVGLDESIADAGEIDGTTVLIYAGSGGSDADAGSATGTGGTLDAGTTTIGVFQVTID